MKIEIENGKAYIYTPFNQDFVNAIKNFGGAKWNGKAWVVNKVFVDEVREIMLNIYGETDVEPSNKINIKITFLERFEEDRSGITLFGKTIATATGRDSGAIIGEDVAFLKGSPRSGGSVKNWYTVIPKDAECMVYNIPERMIEKEYSDIKVEIIENKENDSIFINEKIDDLQRYIEENFNLTNVGALLIANILKYVEIQKLSKDKTIDLFMFLFDGLGIEKKEIKEILYNDREV